MRRCMWLGYETQDSALVSMTTLYALKFVTVLRLFLFQTCLYSFPKLLFALDSSVLIYLSIFASDEIIQPR